MSKAEITNDADGTFVLKGEENSVQIAVDQIQKILNVILVIFFLNSSPIKLIDISLRQTQ